ncbi:MAG: response regulator transcription factor [bacterium]|nr:response regulator transcription factor [bacterium]
MTESQTRKILIVDDEADILEMLESLLEVEGYEVIVAESGAEALEALEERPALIMLDIMMPDMDGHAVLKRIREKYSSDMIPIIMVTARNDVLDIGVAMEAGANGFVVKPFNIEDLIRTINGVLENNPANFYCNYEKVGGVTSRTGSGYQQGDRIIFLDLDEDEPDSDLILEALESDGIHMMSILQHDAGGRRQSSVLLSADDGIGFGAFLNMLMSSGKVHITACHIYKDHLDLPSNLMSSGRDYTLE